jgi:hypothetical protein
MVDLGHMGKPGLNRWDPAPDGAQGRGAVRGAKPHLTRRYGSAEPGSLSWRLPVIKTVATGNVGIPYAAAEKVLRRASPPSPADNG